MTAPDSLTLLAMRATIRNAIQEGCHVYQDDGAEVAASRILGLIARSKNILRQAAREAQEFERACLADVAAMEGAAHA